MDCSQPPSNLGDSHVPFPNYVFGVLKSAFIVATLSLLISYRRTSPFLSLLHSTKHTLKKRFQESIQLYLSKTVEALYTFGLFCVQRAAKAKMIIFSFRIITKTRVLCCASRKCRIWRV